MASTPGLSSYRLTSSHGFIQEQNKSSQAAAAKDITDKFDVSNKEPRYRSDTELIRFMGANSSRRDFDNFEKIRNSLEGRDKSLFEMSALKGLSMLGELNSLFKYYNLSSVEGTSFLDAFSELDEDEMKMLIEIRQSYGPTGSKDKEKYILASGLSILSKEDQSNFIKAVHKNPDKINEIYELAFGMTEKDRSRFLSAAAKSGENIDKFIDMTSQLDNSQLEDLLDFMEELSEKNASKLLEKEDISLEDLNSLAREISILDQNERSAVLNTIINKGLSIDAVLKASQKKTDSEKNEFFQDILDTYYKGVNEIL